MSKKLKRDDYDVLDRALSEVEGAEESGVGSHASMRANLSRGSYRGNPCGSSLCRSLLEFFLGQMACGPGRVCFQGYYCLQLLLLRFSWQLHEVSRKRPWTSFYPCRSRTGHPMMYSHEARKAFQERPHLYFGSRKGNPHAKRAAHTNAQMIAQFSILHMYLT